MLLKTEILTQTYIGYCTQIRNWNMRMNNLIIVNEILTTVLASENLKGRNSETKSSQLKDAWIHILLIYHASSH